MEEKNHIAVFVDPDGINQKMGPLILVQAVGVVLNLEIPGVSADKGQGPLIPHAAHIAAVVDPGVPRFGQGHYAEPIGAHQLVEAVIVVISIYCVF